MDGVKTSRATWMNTALALTVDISTTSSLLDCYRLSLVRLLLSKADMHKSTFRYSLLVFSFVC